MSRRDGIRAGSVSGPWRSGPREDAVAPELPGRAERPPVVPEMLPADMRAAPRQPRSLLLWTAVGVVAALVIVAAAFLVRPATAPQTSVPAAVAPAPEAAATGSTTTDPAATDTSGTDAAGTDTDAIDAVAAAGTAGPVLAGISSVRLRIGPDFPSEREQSILAALAAAGLDSVRVESLPFEIATSRVGYYRDADLAAAEALGQLVAPVLGGGEIGVRDYSQLLSEPEPGRLDLWIGG